MANSTNQADWLAFALLLIDVQCDFWPESIAQAFPQFAEKVTRLLAFCRTVGIEMIHLCAAFAPDPSNWMAKYHWLGRVPCVWGTHGIEALSCAAALPGEPVLEKQIFDGFQAPGRLPLLRAQRKRFVLTAGLKTSIVYERARHDFHKGWHPPENFVTLHGFPKYSIVYA
ncbi:MAG: isochorismatase family protein [Caldilineaceae bacterium]